MGQTSPCTAATYLQTGDFWLVTSGPCVIDGTRGECVTDGPGNFVAGSSCEFAYVGPRANLKREEWDFTTASKNSYASKELTCNNDRLEVTINGTTTKYCGTGQAGLPSEDEKNFRLPRTVGVTGRADFAFKSYCGAWCRGSSECKTVDGEYQCKCGSSTCSPTYNQLNKAGFRVCASVCASESGLRILGTSSVRHLFRP